MRGSKRRIYRGVLCAIVLAVLSGGTRGESESPISVSFALQDANVTLHEPIFVNFSVRNTGTERVNFDLGFDRKQSFRFSITQADGSTVQLRPYLRGGLGRSGEVTLSVGEAYNQSILMNELFDFSKPGNYTIVVGVAAPIRAESGHVAGAVQPAKLALQVADRDPQRLAEVCNRLAKTATGADQVLALDAGHALAYVRDPVAVPYLDKVLSNADLGVRSVAAKGLARIGSPEAVQVLQSHLNTADALLRFYVQAALLQIKEGREFEPRD